MADPTFERRFKNISNLLVEAARAAGRPPTSVKLLAVSKLHPVEKIREALIFGQRAFGENYVQEAIAKVDAAADPRIEWHFIGRIQTNKVKAIANRFAYVHSVERFAIAEKLDRATEGLQKIFVQFNVAEEASKGGADAGEIEALIVRIAAECPRLSVVGLMVMPPLSEDPEATRPHFRRARELLARLKARHPDQPLDQLSMGTSGDFEVAISEGATWVRIGTEVFGPRPAGPRGPDAA